MHSFLPRVSALEMPGPARALLGALGCALLVSAAAASFVSCAGGQWHSITLSDGTVVRWAPAEPKIGDLATVEVSGESAVGNGTGLVAGKVSHVGPVRDPSGSAIDSRATEFAQGSKKIRWAFRVTSSGTWTIDVGEKRQMLWNAETVSGKETELKKFDGESLWHGSKPKALQASSGAQAPAGAQAVSP